MRAGRATALLDPHGVPCWVRAAAAWHARLPAPDPALDHDYPMETYEGPGGLYRLVRTLADDPRRLVVAQNELLPRVCPTGAAERVAEAIAEAAQMRAVAPQASRLAPAEVVARPVPRVDGLKRAVNLYITDGEPFGGVPVWCDRMSRAFAERADLGWEVRTLIVSTRRWWREGEPVPSLEPEALEPSVCLIDPSAGPAAAMRTVRASLEALAPDIVTPQYGDLCHAVAASLAPTGVRTVVMMQTDDWVYRSTLDAYPHWHGAVGGSDACGRFVEQHASGRPVATIRNAVPVLNAPRAVAAEGPLRLAYVGRMAELQKRLSDLHTLADELDRRAVDAEIHLVGDGPDLDTFLARERERSRACVRFIAHGVRSPAWVAEFWSTMDICTLVSENEGTSIVTLEAMGCGVVPVVTRVGSGAEDWIDNGTSGVIVEIADMPAMADALAELHADRAKLASMARAAWEAVRDRAHLHTAAEAYAEVFDAVCERPIEATPTDAAVRLLESHRWQEARSTDQERDTAYLRERLAEAGYRAIEEITTETAEPTDRADALVVTAPPTPKLMQRIAAWRNQGLGVALAPGVIEPEWVRLAAGLDRAAQHGSRLAIYGAGDHTRRAARALDWARERGLEIVAIIDDEPRTTTAFGLPLTTPADALARLKIDAVVLSSDAWEGRMWDRSRPLRDAGVHIEPLYGRYTHDTDPPAIAFPRPASRLTASA
jgi:glycosyltransferase involved in cell wall biosynthesis